MKLYLVKHIREVSLDRYGTEEALEDEKQRRQKRKFEKDSTEVLETFTLSTLHTAGAEKGGGSAGGRTASSSSSTNGAEVLHGVSEANSADGGNIVSAALEHGFIPVDGRISVVYKEGASSTSTSSNKKQKKMSVAAQKHAQRKKALSAMISSVKASHRATAAADR